VAPRKYPIINTCLRFLEYLLLLPVVILKKILNLTKITLLFKIKEGNIG
jgi:hypothetical protein